MNFEQAFSLLREGLPIRRASWVKCNYFKTIRGNLYLCRDGEGSTVLGFPNISIGAIGVDDIMADDWEPFTGKVLTPYEIWKNGKRKK